MRWMILALILLAGCGTKTSAPPAADAKAEAEPHRESATRWTARTELFVEWTPLVPGQVSRFAIHLTRLDNFRAMTKGAVEVLLHRVDGATESFRVEGPSRPGIFGVDVKPSREGVVEMSILVTGEGIVDRHELGAVPVAARHKEEPAAESNAIAFLKEQQWTLDFATTLAKDQPLRESLRVPAEVAPRSGGQAEADAPFAGRLSLDRLPVMGARVQAGQVLTHVLLPAPNPSDLAGLELAQREAQASLALAQRDRDRADRLVKSGAAPAKRLDEAQTTVALAEARLQAAQARLAQLAASQRADGELRPFAIKAPIAGIVSAVKSAPGANVNPGDPIVEIVDPDTVHVSAIVPEAEFPRMRGLTAAELEIPGADAPRRLARLVTVGRVVDAPSRTFPVIYEFDNRERLIAINQTVHVRLLFANGANGPTIPESALVDDGGRPVVFVQTGGESFERRAVKLGARNGGFVQVTEGLQAGDRVVSKGAHLIRLASMSSQVPAHGHVH